MACSGTPNLSGGIVATRLQRELGNLEDLARDLGLGDDLDERDRAVRPAERKGRGAAGSGPQQGPPASLPVGRLGERANALVDEPPA